MAFGGSITVTSLGANLVRINGPTLAAGANGTIGLNGSGAGIELPASFPSGVDSQASALGLGMVDLVEVRLHRHSAGGAEATHIHVDQAETPFTLTLSNDTANGSGTMEVYVQYHHSRVR